MQYVHFSVQVVMNLKIPLLSIKSGCLTAQCFFHKQKIFNLLCTVLTIHLLLKTSIVQLYSLLFFPSKSWVVWVCREAVFAAVCVVILNLSDFIPSLKSQTKEAGTASGVASGQGDQAMSQELPSPNPDLRPPLPPAHHLPSLPAGKGQDTAAPVKSHKGKAGKGEQSWLRWCRSVRVMGLSLLEQDVACWHAAAKLKECSPQA